MKLTTVELQGVFEGMMAVGATRDQITAACVRLNAEDPDWYCVEQLVKPLLAAVYGMRKPSNLDTPRSGPEWNEYLRKLRSDG